MTVALEEGLTAIGKALEEAGHRLVPLYGYSGGIDAVVYRNAAMTELPLSAGNYSENGGGILVICARHMTPEQVLLSLRHKTCGGRGIFEF